MILGILSDSHNRQDLAATALQVLQEAGAEAFVHCGDVGRKGVFDQLAGLRSWFVWGNSDHPGPQIAAHLRLLGIPQPAEVPLRLELAGRMIAVFHGHEAAFGRMVDLAAAGRLAEVEALLEGVDYVLFGHSHVPHDQRIGSVRLINPGALHRVRTRSVATLDLERDLLRFWHVGGEIAEPGPRLVELPGKAPA